MDPRGADAHPGQGRSAAAAGRGRTRALLALKGAASLGLLLWVLSRTGVHDVLAALRSASRLGLLLAAAMCLLGNALAIARWRILLGAQDVRPRWSELIASYGSALFLNNVLPSTVGGDAIRVYDSWRFGSSKAGALAAIFIDRFFGLIALVLFALGAGLLWQGVGTAVAVSPLAIAGLAAAMLGGLAGLVFLPRWLDPARVAAWPLPGAPLAARILEQLGAAFAAFSGRPSALLWAFALSLLLQLNVVAYYYVSGLALGMGLALPPFFMIVPLAVFAMMLPISISGVGLRENAFLVLLSAFGVASAQAIALAWFDYGLMLLQGLMGAAAYLGKKSRGFTEDSHGSDTGSPPSATSPIARNARGNPGP